MSNFSQEEIAGAFESLKAGRWSEVSPSMMSEVEAMLNASPDAASDFESLAASPGDDFPVTDVHVEDRDWESVWTRIEQGVDDEGDQAPASRRARWLSWAPALSIAAGLVLVVSLPFVMERGERSNALRLAGPGDAQVESVEVFDDSMPFIHSAVDEGDVSILWIVEESS